MPDRCRARRRRGGRVAADAQRAAIPEARCEPREPVRIDGFADAARTSRPELELELELGNVADGCSPYRLPRRDRRPPLQRAARAGGHETGGARERQPGRADASGRTCRRACPQRTPRWLHDPRRPHARGTPRPPGVDARAADPLGGSSIGPSTGEFVGAMLKRHRHSEHGYRGCLGLLSLARRYGRERLEAACALAIEPNTI